MPKVPKGVVMKQATILIIEDDADIVELLQYNLAKEGFKVRVARGETPVCMRPAATGRT
ncbi:MAG: hypothetical protein R3E96_16315 [Planctomycetota bacterium]